MAAADDDVGVTNFVVFPHRVFWVGSAFELCQFLRILLLAFRRNKFQIFAITVEIQWLEQLWNHENMFETGEVRAYEC